MHYENIPTVRLLIIAEIYGLTAAELRAAFKLQSDAGAWRTVARRDRLGDGVYG